MEGAGPTDYTMTLDGEPIFHIASVTKILVAVAVFIAIEVKAKDAAPSSPYAKFQNIQKDIQKDPITKVYNRHSTTQIGGLPGNPSIYNLIVHNRGIRTSNHHLLAFDGTPIMTTTDIGEDLIRPIARDATYIDIMEAWTEYSNTNYAVIAMTVEALWGGSLDSFMHETLFKPLGMNRTSIGFPTGSDVESHSWVVNSEGFSYPVERIRYRADGAEAGALGAYSTARDIDIFYKFLLDSFHGTEIIPGFDLDILGKILKMTNKETEEVRFTPLGLYTTLDSSVIGSQSSNRLQFPDDIFSTYPVLPGALGKNISTYHMVGSAIGCNCATAFYPSPSKGSHALVVLTDTSGPVDSADHILRLLLRLIARSQYSDQIRRSLRRAHKIEDMVERAKNRALQNWKEVEQFDVEMRAKAPKIAKDITGDFKGQGFSQQVHIHTSLSGNTTICMSGASTSYNSGVFDLVWIDENSVKVCVPPHLSIDCLGNGDWSNLEFMVESHGLVVTKLMRKTASGIDHYVRVSRM